MSFNFLHFPKHFFIFLALGVFLMIAAVYVFVDPSVKSLQQDFTQQTGVNLQECEKYPHNFKNYEESQRYQCYLEKTAQATRKFGIAATVSAFQNYFQTDGGQALEGPTCHTIAHVIGEVAVSLGIESEKILNECKTFCTGGCLNGAGHYNVLTTQGIEKAEEFCNSANVSHELLMDCYHGLGHGITEYVGFGIEKGISMCNQLNNERDGRFECGHAVLMEWNQIMTKSVPVPVDISAFCSKVDEIYRDICYEFAGSLEYTKSQSAADALGICSKKVPKYLADRCMGTAVEALYHSTPRQERPGVIASVCDFPEKDKTRMCYYKAVNASIFTIGASAGEAGLVICGKAPNWLQSDCYLKISSRLFNEYGEDSRNMFCKNIIPNKYRNKCLTYIDNLVPITSN
jgi:hypothetical protein